MSKWINIKEYGLPGESDIVRIESSDTDVNVCTNKGRVFSAYTYMEKLYNKDGTDWEWVKEWVMSLTASDPNDYLDEDEVITHWQPLPEPPEN